MKYNLTPIKLSDIPTPGQLFKKVIREKGYTLLEFEQVTGVSQSYLSRLISGKKGFGDNLDLACRSVLKTKVGYWIKLQKQYRKRLTNEKRQRILTI